MNVIENSATAKLSSSLQNSIEKFSTTKRNIFYCLSHPCRRDTQVNRKFYINFSVNKISISVSIYLLWKKGTRRSGLQNIFFREHVPRQKHLKNSRNLLPSSHQILFVCVTHPRVFSAKCQSLKYIESFFTFSSRPVQSLCGCGSSVVRLAQDFPLRGSSLVTLATAAAAGPALDSAGRGNVHGLGHELGVHIGRGGGTAEKEEEKEISYKNNICHTLTCFNHRNVHLT